MASLALVQPSLALRGWTIPVGKKTVESMTVGLATVGPRTIVSAIGGRTDDGMFKSMGAVYLHSAQSHQAATPTPSLHLYFVCEVCGELSETFESFDTNLEQYEPNYGACLKNDTSRFFHFFLSPLAFCSGPMM